jgi:hypothetical protein
MISGEIAMVEITCKRSGLKFEAENRRRSVHPSISYYTSHKDMDIRYAAIPVIERGKTEGWKTVEQFEAKIEAALDPPPPLAIDWDLECAWVACISGYSEKFGYNRDFLKEVEKNGRFNRFKLSEDGLYESCYKSNKGNQTRQYFQVKNGKRTEISQSELDSLLGDRPLKKEERLQNLEGCEKVETGEKYLGDAGAIAHWEDHHFEIVDFSVKTEYEDEDGIITNYSPCDTYCVAEYHQYTYWLKPATEEQIAALQETLSDNNAAAAAVKRCKEIARSGGWTTPKDANPRGSKIGYRDKVLSYDSPYLQIDQSAGLLWAVSYNGRDGDDWSFNNAGGGTQVAHCTNLTPELEAEVLALAEVIQRVYPEGIE